MEYVPGWTLRQVLDEHPRHFCEPDDIEPWLRDIVEGLTYLHGEAGRIHRDLKPANVMIETAGRARLMDFGISHRIKEGLTRHSKTGDTSPAANTSSTLAYASPQQLRGEPGKAADDLYSLGALVYELLTGSPPWFRGTPETVRMQILDPQLPLTPLMERRQELVEEGANAEIGKPVPQGWERAVQSCLAKDRAQRPASAGEVLALCLGERDEKAPQQNVYHQPAKTPGTAQATSQSALPDSAPADHGDDLTHVMKRGGLWGAGWLARLRDKWLPHREAVTTWAGRRWALVIGVLYALLMLFLCLAAWDVLGVHKAGTMEVIPIGWKDVFQPFT